MKKTEIIEKLNNPVWNSLNETHDTFSIKYDGIKFYAPEYCPFGGFINLENSSDGIDNYSAKNNNFYVVGKKPLFSNALTLNKNLVCNQMILDKPINISINEQIVELKTQRQKTELFHLVNKIQPGYFNSKTSDLGNYFGIYKDEKLIAVTGERMKMNEFTEISAVITHPEHTGKGYAKQLIKQTTNQIFKENKIPYLHVAESNIGAIKLYEKLGFTTRRKISFWNFKTV
ncbi:GNAT family N-acetyltransferase [Tenacibaculum soleae]|uniref:Acetyltransferase n=1 Tax=Tenacibaculum soleae TaxID=447689 RepID=A0A1B9XZM8_9FLAO|nr:GNAT family N-acetyltransferase [Tenacibaculum soleae]MDO6811993.1 GNAT family N-acetyltransferase [Tenacibaculum soleae]OCK42921.1 acetyltransferase [Tenacibaculum soleae]